MTRRRCCCAREDACLIWLYNPTIADIGQPVDPPWQVSGTGSCAVIKGPDLGEDFEIYDAVLRVTGPLKFYHRTPHRDRHPTGKLRIGVVFPSWTANARYRALYNAVKSGGVIGASEYFVYEWIPFLGGNLWENGRFFKQTTELLDLREDAPSLWDELKDFEPDKDTLIQVIYRCRESAEDECDSECEHCKDGKAPKIWEIIVAGMIEGTCGDCVNLDGKYRVYQVGATPCKWTSSDVGGKCDPAQISLEITESGGTYTMTVSLGNHVWAKSFAEKPDCCASHELTHVTSSGDCDSSSATCLVSPPEVSGQREICMSGITSICEEPYEEGYYVGFEIPDEVTVYITEVGFYETEDTYDGGEGFCKYCPCNYWRNCCIEVARPVTLTYESSCPAIDGHTIELPPIGDLNAPPFTEGLNLSGCGQWGDNAEANQGLGYICTEEWTIQRVMLLLVPGGHLHLPPFDSELSEWWLFDIGCVQGVPGDYEGDRGGAHPNENSTLDPFYLEFGPFPLFITNPEDPIEEWTCCCLPCDLEDCEWFKVIITQSA